MGFFSYTCAKTFLPIMASTSWPEEYCRVAVVSKDDSVLRGTYDGYGRVFGEFGEVEIDYENILSGRIKMVAERFYKGERWADIPNKSHDDIDQGHFHDEDKIEAWYKKGGFASYREYVDAYKT